MIDTIIHGDALETLKSMPDNYVDLVVTDIPYKIQVKQSTGAFGVLKRMHYKRDLEASIALVDKELLELEEEANRNPNKKGSRSSNIQDPEK